MSNKSDLAYMELRQRIISCEIAPNTPLRIQSLGASTGFGSTPIREALRRLESEWLVVSAINCGFKTAPISTEQLQDLEASRIVIETALLIDSIKEGTDAWEANIVAAHFRLKKAVLPVHTSDKVAIRDWTERHQGFHDALLSAAGSETLAGFHHRISEQLKRHYHYTLGEPLRHVFEADEDVKAVLADALGLDRHTDLMEAVLNRDADRAAALLDEHIRLASRIFSEIFTDSNRQER